MSLVVANGIGVIGGSIEMNTFGLWIADLTLDNPEQQSFAPGSAVDFSTGNGGGNFAR